MVVKPRNPDNEFINKLIYLMKDEGRRMVDVTKALGFSTAHTVSMELRNSDQDKPEALKSLCNSVCYRKLKVFSVSPFPGPGEETFETWLEEVTERMQLGRWVRRRRSEAF